MANMKKGRKRLEDLLLSLPREILFDVLSRLPIKSLVRCRSLSKNWLHMVTSPGFVRLHAELAKQNKQKILFASSNSKSGTTDLHSISENETTLNAAPIVVTYHSRLPTALSIVGTCNGLVFLSDYKTTIVLCNPATRERFSLLFNIFKVLPAEHYKEEVCLGFGHDPISDEYKVMRLDFSYRKSAGADAFDDDLFYTENTDVYVYTLGSLSWRKLHSPPFPLHRGIPILPYVNGALHVFERTHNCRLRDNPQIICSIIAFDVKSEKFKRMSTPHTKGAGLETGVLQGCLSMCATRDCFGDIWLMKKHGVRESWAKVFSIPFTIVPQLVPLMVRKDGVVLLQSSVMKSTRIYAYDPTTSKVDFHTPAITDRINANAYVETLVPISKNSPKGRKRRVYTYFD